MHVISSGSIGNSYLLVADNGDTLIIECGVLFKDIKKALNFNLTNVVGCIVTHQHLDHCKGAKELTAAGINLHCLKQTSDSFKFNNHRIKNFNPEEQFSLGEFKIMPFEVKHDVPCVGFLIYHEECGRTVFITDTYFVEHFFTGLNNVIIEANYSEDLIDLPKYRTDRLIQSHMSLQTCKGVLKANDLTKVYQIILIHLSDRNSDSIRFKREIQEQTGKTVHVAQKGLELEFNKTPF